MFNLIETLATQMKQKRNVEELKTYAISVILSVGLTDSVFKDLNE